MMDPAAPTQQITPYLLQTAHKSHCGICHEKLIMLCTDTDPDQTPWFYICWNCKKVSHCGVGPVGKRSHPDVMEEERTVISILLYAGYLIGLMAKLDPVFMNDLRSGNQTADTVIAALTRARDEMKLP